MKLKQVWPVLAVLIFGAIGTWAQEKPAAEKHTQVPLTVQVLFTEYEGEKKIGSLPYTMPINAEAERRTADWSQLRMGVRVPIMTSNNPNAVQQVQYMDVGTNIDCRAWVLESGQYAVELQVERSSIYSVGSEGKRVEWSPDEQLSVAAQPLVRHYRSTMTLLMRDGQTIQRAVATDPVSGRVVKVDVTLNVAK